MSRVNDDLGNRMKTYEGVTRDHLVRRMPVIIRIDGKVFHTFTRGFEKPFDKVLIDTMWETCKYLCTNIQGCKLAYTQSDEISLLLTDYETLTTAAWFDNNIQKIVSVSSSMATLAFNKAFQIMTNSFIYDNASIYDRDEKKRDLRKVYEEKLYSALFDSRVFNVPKEDVCNYFIWRQKDATRNSVEMVGHCNFSDKQLHKKSCNMIQDMLFQEKGINWNDLPTYKKRGACISRELYEADNETRAIRSRWIVDKDIPIFTQDREYIEKYL